MTSDVRGEVYDLGYQRYDGPREGRSRARKALYFDGVKLVLGIGRGAKAKILPLLLFGAAMIPAVVFVIILSFASQFTGDGQSADDFVPGPADYNGVIGTLLIIFGAIMAPELLTPDRKDRVLDLYLVRPITSDDYVLMRVAAFLSVVLALVFSGHIVLQVGLLLTASSPWDYFKENWQDIPRFIGAGALVALFITLIPMAVASFTSRRAYASAFVIGLFLVSTFVVNALTSPQCDGRARTVEGRITFETECHPLIGESARYVALLSFMDVSSRLNDIAFGRTADPNDASPAVAEMQKLPTALTSFVYLLYVVIPGGLIWSQYRRLRP